jgi:hypothetical protein
MADPDVLLVRLVAEAGHPPDGGISASWHSFPASPLRLEAANGSSYTWHAPGEAHAAQDSAPPRSLRVDVLNAGPLSVRLARPLTPWGG